MAIPPPRIERPRMNLNYQTTLFLVALTTALTSAAAIAQSHEPGSHPTLPGHLAQGSPVAKGPHGGSLRQENGVQLETIVTQGGIQIHVFDRAGSPVSVATGRGVASLRVAGNAKRYRYDLLPDGKAGLTARVNLSKIAGRQIELDIQLIGVSAGRIAFQEVASVPASESQLAAAAITRQKTCPVSGKPLGSMGQPVAVDINGGQVYVCCAGCADAVKADPAKYATGRPQITVTTATAADAALIKRQAKCPVMDEPLGSMGQPIKVLVGEKPIFLCCKGCIKKIQAEPQKYLAMVYGNPTQDAATSHGAVPIGTEQVRTGVYKVTSADAPYVAAQKRCPVMDEPLDAMGGPYKVHAAGKAIYICCPGCAKKIAAEPDKFLDVLAKQGVDAPLLR